MMKNELEIQVEVDAEAGRLPLQRVELTADCAFDLFQSSKIQNLKN